MDTRQTDLSSPPAPVPDAPRKKSEIENLGQFCGTTTWYRLNRYAFPGWLLTDGTQYLAETYGAGWLMDLIASHNKANPKLRHHPFQVWKLVVYEDDSWEVIATDGNGNEVVRQNGGYTKFPAGVTLYAAYAGEHSWLFMLPG